MAQKVEDVDKDFLIKVKNEKTGSMDNIIRAEHFCVLYKGSFGEDFKPMTWTNDVESAVNYIRSYRKGGSKGEFKIKDKEGSII